jgi:hypothetical protein
MNFSTVNDINLISLDVIHSNGANLYIFENLNDLFTIKRIFTITPEEGEDKERGYHAHRKDVQIVTCPHGSISFTAKDGTNELTINLDNPGKAIYVPTYIWGETKYLEENTVVTVYSSQRYDEGSYIRDFNLFLKIRNGEAN